MDYVFVLAGLTGLFLGGEALVRGSVGIARRLAGPPLLIGPIRISGATLRRDTGVMMAATLILIPVLAMGEVTRLSGLVLFAGLVMYLAWAYLRPGEAQADSDIQAPPPSSLVSVLWVIAGLIALMLSARLLVDGGYGISEAFIGLTIVAIGTSLPELATSLIAALRRQSEIAIGNIIGSNIFNLLGILGITAIVTPIPAASRFLSFDLPVLIAASLILTGLLVTRPTIGRGVGAVMLAGYFAYIWSAQG